MGFTNIKMYEDMQSCWGMPFYFSIFFLLVTHKFKYWLCHTEPNKEHWQQSQACTAFLWLENLLPSVFSRWALRNSSSEGNLLYLWQDSFLDSKAGSLMISFPFGRKHRLPFGGRFTSVERSMNWCEHLLLFYRESQEEKGWPGRSSCSQGVHSVMEGQGG